LATLRRGFLPFLIEYIGYTIGFGHIYLRHCDNPMSHRGQKNIFECGPQKRIEIYKPNPAYWQYDGKPVLLLGGDKD